MHLPRHTIESHATVPLFQNASFCSPDPASLHTQLATDSIQTHINTASSFDELSQTAVFSCANLNGFLVAQTDPLKLVANRSWSSSQGGLSYAVPVQHTSLLFLVGGGRVPRFAPNKVVLWDEAAEYTVKPPTRASRDADSDDDDIGSTASWRASTIFSAGSEFDAYGHDHPNKAENVESQVHDQSRSLSPENSLRFSTSSLVHANDVQEAAAAIVAKAIPSQSDSAVSAKMEHSVGASSLGIGRLQDSHLSDPADCKSTTSILSDDSHADMSSSTYSHAIMASSANLADPFAEDNLRSTEFIPDSMNRSFRSHNVHPDSPNSAEASSRSEDTISSATRPTPPQQGLFTSRTPRQSGPSLVDSVSSMATTATNATAKASPKILRGREVVELEFSEVVCGIYATSLHIPPPSQQQDNVKGKARASADNLHTTRKSGTSRICVVFVVLLSSKAIIFELSPPSPALANGRSTSPAWAIQKRTSVQTYKNIKGLGSVAPFYEESRNGRVKQAGAIVAVPGRQKGHVQLLRLRLQNLAAADTLPVLTNATPSAGAASIIVAHESSIAAITLSPNGRLLATASSKGTLIRVWSNDSFGVAGSTSQMTQSSTPGRTGFGAKLVRELRRGTDPATILSIAFAPDASLVAAASDKGTIHIFLLTAAGATPRASGGEQSRSPPSPQSRTANLGRAAAQYLPAGIGKLAGQIPPSVLPQYLKSEWSSAQFRIPLKSFGASSRHYSSPSTVDEGGMRGAVSSAPAGTEKSTEGAWAHMRSRISDIRKGEASVDEKIFLCWILEAAAASDPPSPVASKGSKSESQRLRSDKVQTEGSTSDAQPGDRDPRNRYRLIALTTSGGWYKLAVSLPKTAQKLEVSDSMVLEMYRRDASSQLKRGTSDKNNALDCRLVEFRPMVGLLHGWRA
ncbi:related to HSV2 - Phosphatidylinositol 3,5-bisphosphate-binding protein [Melanopsichium pennsylvanicum]|uniref:Related to HSV2 - Phosphatidylinositol 3,5-bisphosphate-binding protein n=2 Tax=Melanopsichium pennsylvanicum TaxID=63383 RepID=A0AAJ5C7G8_9BASI|nr:putative protein [Melanopsichium pennsylvanicum 4]SNX86563.1 related to HSV2 - Phosphatidylinositol 3,5-bisphosphate-binding protein [Melanopsichium pennsylvanicum]